MSMTRVSSPYVTPPKKNQHDNRKSMKIPTMFEDVYTVCPIENWCDFPGSHGPPQPPSPWTRRFARSRPKSLIDIEGSTLVAHVLRQLYRQPKSSSLVGEKSHQVINGYLVVVFSNIFSFSPRILGGDDPL